MHLKFIQSETAVYMLFSASKVKFAIEAPHHFSSLGLHWEVVRLKKRAKKKQ